MDIVFLMFVFDLLNRVYNKRLKRDIWIDIRIYFEIILYINILFVGE